MNGGFGSSIAGGLCAALALLAAASCGEEKTDETAARKDVSKAAGATVAKTEAPAAASPAASEARKIEGKATLVEGSKPGVESPMRLVIGEAGRLGGSLSIGGLECAVSGVVDDSVVRGWLTCPAAAEGAPPRRGTLVGEKAGESWSGTFAISDDGAATVLGGTWKAGQ